MNQEECIIPCFSERILNQLDVNHLKKMLQNSLEKGFSQSLALRMIIQWMKGGREDCINLFNELIDFVDLETISNADLAMALQESFVFQSEAFRSKYIEVTTNRFHFFERFKKHIDASTSVLIFGRNSEDKWKVQKYQSGEWCDKVCFENLQSCDAVFLVDNNEFSVVAKEMCDKLKIHLIKYDSSGRKTFCKTFGATSPESKLSVLKFKDILAATVYLEHSVDDIFYNKENLSEYSSPSESKIVKLAWQSSSDDFLQIAQKEANDGQTYLSIWKLEIDGFDYNLRKLAAINSPVTSSNWFSYFIPPSTAILRYFPGHIIYFNLKTGQFTVSEENNTIENVVALTIHCRKVLALTDDGCVYIQDACDALSDWFLLLKAPCSLCKYTQISVGSC